ncbi:NupC/NupG family nucleoside CNT transporter [Rhodocyclus tenuis]|uniref:CNT family concentrative nucleoside transporter n=1 Tax=Rhodocyclus tenuis TaxID=1066 RepID=A0A840GKA1_RHOTE|nr:nucleoside transporter C-terminal domain-containing protein [Rhodocyclus tenuis]MBB4248579.1 CNT family concentrative nucleoside transporter [Rhodocyclus tenuis]
MHPLLQSLLGYAAFVGIAWAISEKRRAIPWRTVAAGVLLQFVLAVAILKLPAAQAAFAALNDALLALERATRAGTSLVFGYLGGGTLPFAESAAGASFVLAFQALPVVLVMSALSALLFHWRILPLLVRGLSWLLERTLGVGGAVGLSTAANVFVGMVEAPLLVKPYLARVSRGELFVILSAGMAGVAGTVMALYAGIVGPRIPGALGHILAASFISAPAAIVFAVLMVPPEGAPTGRDLRLPRVDGSSMGAITRGTTEGLQLLLNIVAMLIVLVALVALANQMLAWLPDTGTPWSLQRLLGFAMAPLAWLAGIPWSEAGTAGALLGSKTILNELIAYLELAALPPEALSERSRVIMIYALCGFANLGSLGILIGGLTTMLPERRQEIIALGPRTLVSGTLATLSCGCVVGTLY